jgi:hypothetical protein
LTTLFRENVLPVRLKDNVYSAFLKLFQSCNSLIVTKAYYGRYLPKTLIEVYNKSNGTNTFLEVTDPVLFDSLKSGKEDVYNQIVLHYLPLCRNNG